jgi:hypothetical protein
MPRKGLFRAPPASTPRSGMPSPHPSSRRGKEGMEKRGEKHDGKEIVGKNFSYITMQISTTCNYFDKKVTKKFAI